jgi:adenine-specific DNA-methyltransferase
MPRHRKPEKKPIDQYDHKEASRANNPPVGLVTPETDRDAGKKTYAYDPHIAPSLQFDPHRSQIERLIAGEPQSVFGAPLKEEFELANIGGTE